MKYTYLVIAVVLASLGYYAYWSWLGEQIETNIAAWTEEQRERGIDITHGPVSVHGFPYRVQTTIRDVTVKGKTAEGLPVELALSQVDAWVAPYNLNHIVTRLEGPQTLTLARETQPPLALTVSQADARSSIVLEDGKIARVAIDMANLVLTSDPWPAPVTLNRFQIHTRKPAPTTQDVFVKAEGLDLGRDDLGFGRSLPLFQFHAALPEPHPSDLSPASLDDWRNEGGTVELQRFDVQWGNVSLQTTGTLALDHQRRPIGALTTQVDGHETIVDYFSQQGHLNEDRAALAKASLGFLKAAAGELSVPLNFQDGILSLGPVELASLSPLY